LITVPRFERIPFLYHGFGTADWKESDFAAREEWGGFRRLFLDQIHSNIVHCIRRVPRQKLRGDALVTDLSRVFLVIKTADCLPVLLVDEARRIVAAVHCGWKGTAQGVLGKAVSGMREWYGTEPAALLAAFGPAICGACYEVGEDVAARFAARGFARSLFSPASGRRGKYLFDLREANRLELLRLGVRAENILLVDACTYCESRFLSYRRDGSRAGRMLSFIGLAAEGRAGADFSGRGGPAVC
jgi:YfiH family protein